MKIAILTDEFPPEHSGGGAVIPFDLAREFIKRGHRVLVITTTDQSAKAGASLYEGVDVVRILRKPVHPRWSAWRCLYNREMVSQVRSLLGEFKPDVVHAHNVHIHLSYFTLRVARRFAHAVFFTAHDAMTYHYGKHDDFLKKQGTDNPYHVTWWNIFSIYRFRYNPFRNVAIRWCLRSVTQVVAVSEALKAGLEANGIRNVAVIHNGVDVARWRLSKDSNLDEFRRTHAIEGKKCLLFGGRLSGGKGAEVIVRALPAIVQAEPRAALLIIGRENAYAARMRKLASDLGVQDHLIFLGWISGEDLKMAYHVAEVVVVPSIYLDPFPTVILEAMACKKPVVATCYGGAREMVQETITGRVIDPFDIGAMGRAISEMLVDGRKMDEMGDAGYLRVSAEFTLTRQVDAYEGLFVSALSIQSR